VYTSLKFREGRKNGDPRGISDAIEQCERMEYYQVSAGLKVRPELVKIDERIVVPAGRTSNESIVQRENHYVDKDRTSIAPRNDAETSIRIFLESLRIQPNDAAICMIFCFVLS